VREKSVVIHLERVPVVVVGRAPLAPQEFRNSSSLNPYVAAVCPEQHPGKRPFHGINRRQAVVIGCINAVEAHPNRVHQGRVNVYSLQWSQTAVLCVM